MILLVDELQLVNIHVAVNDDAVVYSQRFLYGRNECGDGLSVIRRAKKETITFF